MSDASHIAARSAVDWFVKLTSGTALPQDYQQWSDWKAASIANLHAWNNVEAISGAFHHLTPDALQCLEKVDSIKRRSFIKHLAIFAGIASSASYITYQSDAKLMLADYRTKVGERRKIVLADGSKLHLNSGTAVDIHFTHTQRQIILYAGEVFLESAHDTQTSARPLSIQSEHGTAQALGTRYSVRQLDTYTKVSVFSDRVKVIPENNPAVAQQLTAGEFIDFSDDAILRKGQADFKEEAWLNGHLAVNDMRLDNLLKEISRYRNGYLKASDEVASIRISGSFPIHDTDAVLESLCKTHRLKMQTVTRYWIMLSSI